MDIIDTNRTDTSMGFPVWRFWVSEYGRQWSGYRKRAWHLPSLYTRPRASGSLQAALQIHRNRQQIRSPFRYPLRFWTN